MKHHDQHLPLNIFLLLVSVCVLTGCPQTDDAGSNTDNGIQVWEKTKDLVEQRQDWFSAGTNDTMKVVRQLYERAKEEGDDVPDDVLTWAKQDLKQIGAWNYRIIEVEASDAETVQATLNEWGEKRWECYWVESMGETTRFHFKKAGRSYLKALPAVSLLKLVAGAGGGGE